MQKYWSKALFYKEGKNCLVALAAMLAVLVIHPLTALISRLNLFKAMAAKDILPQVRWGDWFGDILVSLSGRWLVILVFIVAWLVVSQFQDLRREATGDWLAGMPFTRRQMLGTKWLAGLMAIAVPFLAIFLLLSGFYWVQRDWIATSYGLIPQWALLHCLFLACLYSFLFFVQAVMGHPGAAGAVGLICTLVPWYLTQTIPGVVGGIIGPHDLLTGMAEAGGYLMWPRWLEARYQFLPEGHPVGYQVIYTHYGIKGLVMAAVIIGFYALAQWAYARNSLEKNGQLLMFRFLEPVLIWGFALCFGLLVSVVFGLGFSGGASVLVLGLAAGPAAGYWLAKKAVGYYQK